MTEQVAESGDGEQNALPILNSRSTTFEYRGEKFTVNLSVTQPYTNAELRSAMYVVERSIEAAFDHFERLQKIAEESKQLED